MAHYDKGDDLTNLLEDILMSLSPRPVVIEQIIDDFLTNLLKNKVSKTEVNCVIGVLIQRIVIHEEILKGQIVTKESALDSLDKYHDSLMIGHKASVEQTIQQCANIINKSLHGSCDCESCKSNRETIKKAKNIGKNEGDIYNV
jgi:hypothetical protein